MRIEPNDPSAKIDEKAGSFRLSIEGIWASAVSLISFVIHPEALGGLLGQRGPQLGPA
jgi:hypothetical protein